MQSEYFIFDGVQSNDMDIYIIRTDSGLIASPYFGGQDINEDIVGNRITPYHFGTTKKPIQFTVKISPLEKEWTPQLKNKVGKWLVHGAYKSFQTTDDLGKYYYAMITEAPNFELASNRGYLEVTFRTNSPYAWSSIYTDGFNLAGNTGTTIIEVENMSNVLKKYKPKVEIQLVNGETNVQLKNLSNGGKITKFEGLNPNEVISIDNENEFIKSNTALSNPFSKFNRVFFELVYGVNQIEVTGQCLLFFKSQFPILQ